MDNEPLTTSKEQLKEEDSSLHLDNDSLTTSKTLIDSCPTTKDQLQVNEDDGSIQLNSEEQLKGNEPNSSTLQDSQSFPIDLKRYEEDCGDEIVADNVNVGNIVICLNYEDFLRLEDVLEVYVTDDRRRHLIESRVQELYVSLPSELRSQLVIDMAVC